MSRIFGWLVKRQRGGEKPPVPPVLSFDEALDKLRATPRPAVHVLRTDNAGFSRLGGLPNLPSELAWPSWKGRPLAFLAQIELSQLPAPAPIADLPAEGYLYFFYDQEQSTWGFDPKDRGSWAVLYSSQTPSAQPTAAPNDLSEDSRYHSVPVQFRPITSLPDSKRLELARHMSSEDIDRLWNTEAELRQQVFGEATDHQIGGYPYVVQNDTMELECQLASNGLYCGDESGYNEPRAAQLAAGAADWQLLFQLSSDDDMGAMWGDCGMLYFWIRHQDLARRDFSKVWMVLQCS